MEKSNIKIGGTTMKYTRKVQLMGGKGYAIQTNKVRILAEYPRFYLLEIIDSIGGNYRECADKFSLKHSKELIIGRNK